MRRPATPPILFIGRRFEHDERLRSFGLLHELDNISVADTSLVNICNTVHELVANGPFQYQVPVIPFQAGRTGLRRLQYQLLVPNIRVRHDTYFLKTLISLSDNDMKLSSVLNNENFTGPRNRPHIHDLYFTNMRLNIFLGEYLYFIALPNVVN